MVGRAGIFQEWTSLLYFYEFGGKSRIGENRNKKKQSIDRNRHKVKKTIRRRLNVACMPKTRSSRLSQGKESKSEKEYFPMHGSEDRPPVVNAQVGTNVPL